MQKLRGLSLFANIGVAEAYFEKIGINIVLANEIVEKRADFYKAVYPHTEMICGDITVENTRTEIVDKAIKKNVNFIIATPPCQGMSVAGNRDPHDVRNQLIFYAVDVIKRVKPSYILLENVPRQLKTIITVEGKSIKIGDYLKNELSDVYFFNENTLVKAKDYGVPQLRERNIFLLVKKDLGIHWEFPKKQKEITLEEAIGSLPSLDPLLREGYKMTIEKFPDYERKKIEAAQISKWHRPPVHPWRHVEWMLHTPTGTSAIFNEKYFPQKPDGQPIKAHHNHYRRMSWDKPARTITMCNGYISTLCSVHPGRPIQMNGEVMYSDPRAFSIYELLIVMTIPLDWNIPEETEEPFLRSVIGEGIPSKLTMEIMKELLNQI